MEKTKPKIKKSKAKRLHHELLSNPGVVKFLSMADKEAGVGREAAFIVAMAHVGEDLLHKLVFTEQQLLKMHEPEDDLALAFRLFQLTQNDDGQKLLRKMCKNSGIKPSRMKEISELANQIAVNYSSNLLYPTNQHTDYYQEPFLLREANQNGLLILSALSHAFCQSFDENLCTFYDVHGNGEGVFYSLVEGKSVIIPDDSTAYKRRPLPQINNTRMVAYKLISNEDPEKLKAHFVCRLPLSLLDQYPVEELLQVKINIGPLVAEKLLSNSDDFLKQQCGQLTLFQSYNPSNGVLTVACPAQSAQKLRELAKGTMNDVFEKLSILRYLQWLDDNCNALVKFGPGFEIHEVKPHPSEKDKETIVVKFPDYQKNSGFLNGYLKGMMKEFCKYRGFELQILECSTNYICASVTPSIAKELKLKIGSDPNTSMLPVELKFGNMFGYFAMSSTHKTTKDDPSFPTNCCCSICFSSIDRPYVRLSLCGHVYCDDCFIGLITKTTEYPVRCLSGCLYQILFEDIALVLSRRIADANKIQHLLEPVLRQSLEIFLQAHTDEYIRCQTENCNSLLKKGAEGTSESGKYALMCHGCKTNRCTSCGDKVHEGFTCQEKQAEKFAQEHPELSHWKEELPEKRRLCPNIHCKILIEKRAGCNHMECPQCNIHFCWLCNFQATSSRDVYAHMSSVHRSFGPEDEPGEEELALLDRLNEGGGIPIAQMPDLPVLDHLSDFGQMVQETFQVENEHESLLEHGDDCEAMYRHFMVDLEQHRHHGGPT